MSLNRVRTPCIGVCSTTFGDTVCRGCKRFLHEIVDWNGYTDAQKAVVWQRLDQLLRLVVSNYVEVRDSATLGTQMEFQNLRRQPELSPEGWVPELLKAAGSKPLEWESFGLVPLGDARDLAPGALALRIHEELYALAQAHYDRGYRRPARPLMELLREDAEEA